MENLNALRVFVRVAETRSFTLAAKRLGLTSSAVSKAITRLEQELGVRLLQRTTRSVGLTNDGASFFEHCLQILAQIEDAENLLGQATSRPHGRLRVHLPVGFGRRVIMPMMPRFLYQHPEIVLDAELSDRSVDLAYEGIDIAVQIGEPADARLIARRLCHLRFMACASAEYLAQHGEPRTPDDLDKHHCLAYVQMHTGRYRDWPFSQNGKARPKAVSGRLNVNNAESLLEAAAAGLGIAMISNFIAADAIRGGRLRPVLTDYVGEGPPVSVVYLPSRNLSPKVRAFANFLIEEISGNPDWDKITP
ncbi:LysR family transcriptional regulator [Bordetella sp. 15P40C-2]|uniref:LysR family transcriptional regulator n=1 Tax=Bordetella sp. 15P40C-2 TaxID=2572246 RepID=UPI00132C493A|nr:LysR family transcriptional regulator [Bordetella sp. 15P40C-2]MVW70694.1 LysR family transcriptional regulator [Bordetella sp. 15P40C-2]